MVQPVTEQDIYFINEVSEVSNEWKREAEIHGHLEYDVRWNEYRAQILSFTGLKDVLKCELSKEVLMTRYEGKHFSSTTVSS